MLDVLSFGETLVDFFPDTVGPLSGAGAFTPHVGGAPANVAVALARQGVRVGFMGAVGDDAFGELLSGVLRREGVDVRGLVAVPGARTGLCFVTRLAGGERAFSGYGAPSADSLFPADAVREALIEETALLHLGSNLLINPSGAAATRRAVQLARAHGRTVSCDPNLRGHRWESQADMREAALELIRAADVAKLSREELHVLTGADGEGALAALALSPRALLFVTDGAAGCTWRRGDDRGRASAPAVAVVDTTGAGDAFVAGVLAELGAEKPATASPALIQRAAERGCALGSLACTALGATAGVPRAPRVGGASPPPFI